MGPCPLPPIVLSYSKAAEPSFTVSVHRVEGGTSIELVWVTIAMKKHHKHKQIEEERTYLAYTSTTIVIIEGN